MMNDLKDENIDLDVVNELQDVMREVFKVLRSYGIEQLHVGGLIRLLGSSEELAKQYDDHFIYAESLDEEFNVDLEDTPESTIVNNRNTKLHWYFKCPIK